MFASSAVNSYNHGSINHNHNSHSQNGSGSGSSGGRMSRQNSNDLLHRDYAPLPRNTRHNSNNNSTYSRYHISDSSSDDEFPAPIKFSASVRALLEEATPSPATLEAEVDGDESPSYRARSRHTASNQAQRHQRGIDQDYVHRQQQQQQPQQRSNRPVRQVRIASPRTRSSTTTAADPSSQPRRSSTLASTSTRSSGTGHPHDAPLRRRHSGIPGDGMSSTSPPRVVRVSGNSPGGTNYPHHRSSTSMSPSSTSPSTSRSERSLRTQFTHITDESQSGGDYHQRASEERHDRKSYGSNGVGDNSRNADFVTPAPGPRKKRTVVVSAPRKSPSRLSHGERYHDEEEQPFADSMLRNKQQLPAQRGRLGFGMLVTEDTGTAATATGLGAQQSALRVRRLTGSFLKGPARRGVIRRQSEEDRGSASEQEKEEPGDKERPYDTSTSNREAEEKSIEEDVPHDERNWEPRKRHSPPVEAQERRKTQSPDRPPEIERHLQRNSQLELELKLECDSERERQRARDISPGNHRSNGAQDVYRAPLIAPQRHRRSSLLRRVSQDENTPPNESSRRPPGMDMMDKLEKETAPSKDEHEKEQHYHQRQHHNNPSRENETAPPSPPRKPLLAKNHDNALTPRRAAPEPPPVAAPAKKSSYDLPPEVAADSRLPNPMAKAGSSITPAMAAHSRKRRVQVSVNKRPFTRLDCIGRGGSGRVYRVMGENDKVFALKRVNLEDVDPIALAGYKGEIALLQRLAEAGVDRVVRLHDWESNDEKHALSVLMELGESDLHHILVGKLNTLDAEFDPTFTRYYWKEMLECVKAVHAFNIVHSDLKPANFVLVKGKLKLIDFGIADAIQDNTVNVHRETQIGTPNYMAPEALIDTNSLDPAQKAKQQQSGKMMKLGKPSDVWSLGCILYQMVYGRQPFAHIPNQLQRIMAITNPSHEITFPSHGVGGLALPSGLLRTLKRCLQRDQSARPTVEELLSRRDPFLYPENSASAMQVQLQDPDAVPMTEEMLARILTNVVNHCRARGCPGDEEVKAWPGGFVSKIREALAGEHEKDDNAAARRR